MPDLIISFDSEDFLTPEAADAEAWWAQALTERGIRGSFQVVAELVRSLRQTGRDDVVAALARHEIGYHSDLHSVPPSHPQAIDGLDLGAGIAHVIRSEAGGLADVARTFGTWPVSYCPPGDSWTPATSLAMARMGLRVCCNSKMGVPGRRPYWYCGQLIAGYDLDFQDFYEDGCGGEEAFSTAVDGLVEQTPDDGAVILFTHPCRLVTSAFWDVPFYAGRCPERSQWYPAPLRGSEAIERIKSRCLRMLDALICRRDVRMVDYATLAGERQAGGRDVNTLLRETGLSADRLGDLPLRDEPGEVFAAGRFDSLAYDWPPYPTGFQGRSLIRQAEALAWTAGPARRAAVSA